tara:strand:- start:1789 stop:2499 length:711 start_codon:yes stop_codon:yes gene_type:complete
MTTMSIDEYRALKMTDREEWDANFDGKRCSIEALNSIVVNKRGKGPEKPNYTYDSLDPGPYYDPQGIHLHIWKNKKNINNFNGEQNQNVRHVQFTDDKPGHYCSICHIRNKNSAFKWVQSPENGHDTEKNTKNNVIYDESSTIKNYVSFPPTIENKESKHFPPRCIRNWNTVLFKVLHTVRFDKLEYKISNSKLLYLWPWELTPYQKFKLNCPDYKSKNIFLSDSDNFTETYAYII